MKQPTKRFLKQNLKKHREYIVRLHTQRKLDNGNLEPTAVFERLPNSLTHRALDKQIWHIHTTHPHTNGANTGNNLEEWAANK